MRDDVAGLAVAVGLVLGSAGLAHADPTDTPAPAPSPSAQAAAGAVTTPSLVTTPTPKPTIAVDGGAAAGAAAAATAAAAAGAASGDVLDQLADEYLVGAGGGQLSNLLRVALKLRSMGYKPSKQYLDGLQTAMNYRPNQLPLIAALKDTIAYQTKLKAQMDILSSAQSKQNANSAVMGAGQMPGAGNPAGLAPQPAAGAPVSVQATPVPAPPAP
ncbi:MAG: hypothetical protein ACKOQ4_09740 [Mycobacterium sp.]